MNVPNLPDWLPWWVPILVLIPLGLWALTMILMPFSVIGLKSRLEGVEARLDEIQADIRSLVLRLPESALERASHRQEYYETRPAVTDQGYVQPEPRPPIPPAPRTGNDFIPRRPERGADPEPRPSDPRLREPERPRRDELRADRPAPSPRAEPRLDWRR